VRAGKCRRASLGWNIDENQGFDPGIIASSEHLR
jgi:hypothetical protein